MSKRAVQGSNLLPLDLESSVPPLMNSRRVWGLVLIRLPERWRPRRLFESADEDVGVPRSQVSVEGFEPSTPCARGTCAPKLRYTLLSVLSFEC
jgi:hypothetical protein